MEATYRDELEAALAQNAALRREIATLRGALPAAAAPAPRRRRTRLVGVVVALALCGGAIGLAAQRISYAARAAEPSPAVITAPGWIGLTIYAHGTSAMAEIDGQSIILQPVYAPGSAVRSAGLPRTDTPTYWQWYGPVASNVRHLVRVASTADRTLTQDLVAPPGGGATLRATLRPMVGVPGNLVSSLWPIPDVGLEVRTVPPTASTSNGE